MHLDERIAARARRNHGLVTGTELRAFGLTDSQISYRIRHHGLIPVLPGVFRSPGAPDSHASRLLAAKFWLGRRGHFWGPTAATIMELQGIRRPPRIEVAVYHGHGCSGLEVHRLRPEDRPQIRSVAGLPLPSVEQVLLESATRLPAPHLGLAMDDALRRRLTSVAQLRTFLDTRCGRGVRGTRVLRELVAGRDEADERVRTVFETRMLRILRRIEGLRFAPDFHVRVGEEDFFIDFFLPDPRLGLECHSVKWHGTARSKQDVVRDRRIRALGIELLYFSYDDVVFRERETEAEIRAAIARRLRDQT